MHIAQHYVIVLHSTCQVSGYTKYTEENQEALEDSSVSCVVGAIDLHPSLVEKKPLPYLLSTESSSGSENGNRGQ